MSIINVYVLGLFRWGWESFTAYVLAAGGIFSLMSMSRPLPKIPKFGYILYCENAPESLAVEDEINWTSRHVVQLHSKPFQLECGS